MNNPHESIHQYCKEEKRKAMTLWDNLPEPLRHNCEQAINAWDELVGQLYKPKPINAKQFEKTKQTALQIVGYMKPGAYKDHTKKKIEGLQL